LIEAIDSFTIWFHKELIYVKLLHCVFSRRSLYFGLLDTIESGQFRFKSPSTREKAPIMFDCGSSATYLTGDIYVPFMTYVSGWMSKLINSHEDKKWQHFTKSKMPREAAFCFSKCPSQLTPDYIR
jgi:hypothetical protein